MLTNDENTYIQEKKIWDLLINENNFTKEELKLYIRCGSCSSCSACKSSESYFNDEFEEAKF